MLFTLSKISDIELLQSCILENLFISAEKKQLLCNIYFTAAKARRHLRYFARVIRYKKLKQAGQQCDFYGTDFKQISQNQKMILIIDKSKYWFRISDMMELWKRALSFNTDLFTTPINFKNPYTGIAFKKHHLYNIFFYIMDSPFIMPPIIYAFFKQQFDLLKFKIYYYPQLQDLAIGSYFDTLRDSKKYIDITEMLLEHDSILQPILSPTLPIFKRQRVIKLLDHLLKKHYFTIYSLNPLLQAKCKTDIHKELNDYLESGVIHALFE